MTWEIVVGILTLIGGFGGIAKVVSNNTKAMTELKCGIIELKDKTEHQESDLDYVGSKVDDHEIRLIKLEGKVNGGN